MVARSLVLLTLQSMKMKMAKVITMVASTLYTLEILTPKVMAVTLLLKTFINISSN